MSIYSGILKEKPKRFLLIYIKPYNQTILPNSIVTGLHDKFEENTFSNLTIVFLKVYPSSPPQPCFKINFPNIELGSKSVARTINNSQVSYTYTEPASLSIYSNDQFFRIYISKYVTPTTAGSACSNILTESLNYTFGSQEKLTLVSELKLQEFKQNYETNYEALKQSLNIPAKYEFGISADIIGGFDLTKPIPQELDVTSENYMEKVLYSDGHIENKEFNFKIW